MRFVLRSKTHTLKGPIALPASKSLSNRVLIIRALAQRPFEIENLSDADDTVIMQKALDRNDLITDIGPAGTAMRFLTAFYAIRPGEKVLTGSARMKQRPIAILVEALQQLGAHITYLEKPGYPPIHIEGRRLKGGRIKVSGQVSSQFITALMLIGPTLPQALEIEITGDPLSRPYISMTKELMEQCGAQVTFDGSLVIVKPGRYRSPAISIEFDWSAAAFWMAFAAMSRKADLHLAGLKENSLQGDRAATELFTHLGIESEFDEHGLRITNSGKVSSDFMWNFRHHPDLVQPAAIAAAALGVTSRFEGLNNLRLKETDRIEALQLELKKIGCRSEVAGHDLQLFKSALVEEVPELDVYSDHRMAMSLAALSMKYPVLTIRDPMVVAKSYPRFWKEVEKFVDVRPGK